MWSQTADYLTSLPKAAEEAWTERFLDGRHERSLRPHPAVVVGLITLGLGVLAWYYVGHDVKRYIRIRSM